MVAASGPALGVTPDGHGDWRTFIEAPATRDLSPTGVVSTSGNVRNATALTTADDTDSITLSYAEGGPAPVIVLDYGKNVGGTTSFDVVSKSGLPTLRSSYSETLKNLSETGDYTNQFSPTTLRYDTFPVTRVGTIQGSGIQGAERYQMITLLTPGSVTLSRVRIHFTGELGTADTLRGHFLSSDDTLNRAWYASVYTVNLNQMMPGGSNGPLHLLLDGAKRDRSVWSGDILASGPTVYAALDPVYVRDSIQLLGEHPATVADYLLPAVGTSAVPGPMPGVCQPNVETPACMTFSMSYSTVFVPVLADYVRYTGDMTFAAEQWANVVRVLAWTGQQRDAKGLITTTSTNGKDWKVDDHTGEATWNNLIYYAALTDGAELASALGRDAAASAWRTQAAALRTAINTHLWNPTTGVYDISDSSNGAIAQDANTFAALTGVADPVRSTQILGVLDKRLQHARGHLAYAEPAPAGEGQQLSTMMSGWEVMADLDAGRTTAALDLIRREWGYMLRQDPGGTTWENIPMTGDLDGAHSAAHSWGSLPAAALSRYVLGIRPTTPGFDTFVVAPQPGDLSWAAGDVPTPYGPVSINWSQGAGCRYTVDVTVPPGTTATVSIPGGKTISGVTPGDHRYMGQPAC
ncbi:alpha-L-rhamnosidase C-terminal domain-containing protein [Phycicoccus sp. Soil803]|uniref:alpha-L-rhamnosidase C-terminal domain-containing protein n=1 Tax=Phycicoccus sp. Soil803 TaxID=1736415 RepID=UPI00070F9622|nr:alpha-L-rhamnosidase C-terminal domain-containing protein [Phycicoccus sp. Soil803]KRF21823.1 hypothetical protein ASG95_20550 [Phycicoccus sp. Soil803]